MAYSRQYLESIQKLLSFIRFLPVTSKIIWGLSLLQVNQNYKQSNESKQEAYN